MKALVEMQQAKRKPRPRMLNDVPESLLVLLFISFGASGVGGGGGVVNEVSQLCCQSIERSLVSSGRGDRSIAWYLASSGLIPVSAMM